MHRHKDHCKTVHPTETLTASPKKPTKIISYVLLPFKAKSQHISVSEDAIAIK